MINLFEPSPKIESLKFIKNVFRKKYFHESEYSNLFLKNFSKFQKIKQNNLVLAASCSDLIFNVMFTFRDTIKNKKVIIPSNSFPAIPSAIIRAGLKMHVVDIDKASGNISIESLKKIKKKKDIGCIFLTHYGGIPSDIGEIRRIFGKKVLIFEDCAGALGSFHENGNAVGKLADYSCWSFDPMKMISCGEGGLAYIKDKRMLIKFKQNIKLGININQLSGFQISKKKRIRWWEYNLEDYGSRSVFTEINAAIGIPQIRNILKTLKKRDVLRKTYIKNLNCEKNLHIMKNIRGKFYSNYFFTIFAKKRDDLANYLYKNGVYTSLRYYPIHKNKIFKKFCDKENFNNSNFFLKNALNLPIHQNLKINEVRKICKIINDFYRK